MTEQQCTSPSEKIDSMVVLVHPKPIFHVFALVG